MNVEIEKVLQKILLHELQLPDDYGEKDGFIVPSVYIVAPNVHLGSTDKLQIGIQSIGSRIISSHHREKEINNQYTEIKEIVISDNIQIDIKSRNNDARIRRFEVLTALESVYSKQLQEQYECRIFEIPSGFVNSNEAEGSSQIYRYTTTIATQYKKIYKSKVDYYDTFPIEASIDTLDNKTSFVVDKDFKPFE